MYDTAEWMPIFVPSLWLFAIYRGSSVAAVLGVVWVVGRIVYFLGYIADPTKRFPGFFIQALAVTAPAFGAFGRLIYLVLV